MKGLFITFEGIDGGGKTTQLALAAKWLREQGYEVVESREPGGTPLAERVRELVLDPSLPLTTTTQTLLYLAARSEHVDKLLRPSVEAGKIVLCDRFSDSTLVYQGLSQGKSLEELALLRNLCSFASAGMAPDLTLVFDGRPHNGLCLYATHTAAPSQRQRPAHACPDPRHRRTAAHADAPAPANNFLKMLFGLHAPGYAPTSHFSPCIKALSACRTEAATCS